MRKSDRTLLILLIILIVVFNGYILYYKHTVLDRVEIEDDTQIFYPYAGKNNVENTTES